MLIRNFTSIVMAGLLCLSMSAVAQELPELPPFPEIPAKQPVNSVKMQSSSSFQEVQLDLPITDGPYEANWVSIEKNYPGTPQWLRDAKFGIWVHFGPQAAGESGDWYARNLYKQGHTAYNNHCKNFGHPSEVGYKEVLRDWNPTKLDPEYLTQLYQKAGARFLMIQGVHHDNFDLWNSQYQPWNSVNMGPKRDLLREWVDACHKYNMRYGVTFHHEYTWWWWQTAFQSDNSGAKKGMPYDGNLTLADGVGKWWEGYDPRMLYGVDLREYQSVSEKANTEWTPADAGIFHNHLDYCEWYAKQWALRMMDVTHNYDPDFIYTDGTVQGPFTGNGTGTGYKCNAMQTVMADYYNLQLKEKGKVDAFSIIKFRDATNGAITTEEHGFPAGIRTDQDWIRETPIGDWFYAPGFVYDAATVIRYILEAASRDGNAAINICFKPDGSIDDAAVTMLEKVGDWMKLNGEAIYGSTHWKNWGEGSNTVTGNRLGASQANAPFNAQDIRYTVGKDGTLYATCLAVPTAGQKVAFKSLGLASEYIKNKVTKVELLGYDGEVEFKQDFSALQITMPKGTNSKLCSVFKITFSDATVSVSSIDRTVELLKEATNFARTPETNNGKRFGAPLNWTVENFDIPNGNDGTKHGIDAYNGWDAGPYGGKNSLALGVWDDRSKNTTGDISNARIYQKVQLPAGNYYFGATFNQKYNLNLAYIFVSTQLLNTADIPSKALASESIMNAVKDGPLHGVNFTLTEPTEVYLGFQANLNGNNQQEFRATTVALLEYEEGVSVTDVTEECLVEPSAFSRTAHCGTGRYGTPLNWTVENYYIPTWGNMVRNGIDSYPGYDCLSLGIWDDLGSNVGDATDARIYRTVKLQPGRYYFAAQYQTTYNISDQAYIFASTEKLSTADIPTRAIAYDNVNKAGEDDGLWHGFYFNIDKEQTVLLGWQANLKNGPGQQEFRAKSVKLLCYENDEATAIEEIINSKSSNSKSYYDLQGRPCHPAVKGIYIVNGKKVVVK